MDACKIVKGLKPKSHHFLTKEAVIPEAPIETKGPEEETEVASKKGSKKKTKKEMALNLFCDFSQVDIAGGRDMSIWYDADCMFHPTLKIRCSQDKKAPLSAEEQKELQKLPGRLFGVSK